MSTILRDNCPRCPATSQCAPGGNRTKGATDRPPDPSHGDVLTSVIGAPRKKRDLGFYAVASISPLSLGKARAR